MTAAPHSDAGTPLSLTSALSESPMCWLLHSHALVPILRSDSCVLSELQENRRQEQNSQHHACHQDMQASKAHAGKPILEDEKNDDRDCVAGEHNTYQCIAHDLVYCQQEKYSMENLVLHLDSNQCSMQALYPSTRSTQSRK